MKPSGIFKYPLTYLILLLLIYTVYDYFDHINRSGSVFEEHPNYWLLFTTAGFLSFVILVLALKTIAQRIFNRRNLFIEVLAIGLWIGLYLSVIGPIFDRVLWPYGELIFNFKIGPFAILLAVYFLLRLLINILLNKNALYSK